jgi:hypothetical protein
MIIGNTKKEKQKNTIQENKIKDRKKKEKKKGGGGVGLHIL